MPKPEHTRDDRPKPAHPARPTDASQLADATLLLAQSISHLAREICEQREQKKIEFEWIKSHAGLATKLDLKELETHIMSAISEFAAKQKTFNDRQATAIDKSVESITALVEDVKTLNEKIEELQNSPGGVTPADQELIDDLETQGEAVATKAEGVATALKALDDQTPPAMPNVP